MNKSDFKLIIILLVIVSTSLIIYKLLNKNDNKEAVVYYENDILLTIDLSLNKEYQIEGYNGPVDIIVKNGKIKVANEFSPLHLCSNQGYISETYETIVCLPNKITIKIENKKEDLDTIVK